MITVFVNYEGLTFGLLEFKKQLEKNEVSPEFEIEMCKQYLGVMLSIVYSIGAEKR